MSARAVRRSRVWADRWSAERGTSSLEFAIIYAALLTLIILAVHFGMVFNAVLSVEDAAGEALEAYTAVDGGAPAATNVVQQLLEGDGTIARYVLEPPTDTGGIATITVRAEPVAVIPGLASVIERTVTGPMEAFVLESERDTAIS